MSKPEQFILPPNIRRATDADVPALRSLVNAAYQELALMGLNFTGTYQDEALTRERMENAEAYLLFRKDELVAAVNLSVQIREACSPQEQPSCLYINQLAVRPDHKRQGLGTLLLDLSEHRARSLSLAYLRLDTALTATHLVQFYKQRGFRPVQEVQWEGKTYRSVIMEKRLASRETKSGSRGRA